MAAQWADDVHHALHAWVSGETHGYYVDFGSAATLAHALTRVFVHDGGWSTFRGRPWGAPVPPGTDGHRFVVFGSDHDQVGNRALGDRPRSGWTAGGSRRPRPRCSPRRSRPMLFMGEEWGASTPFQYFTDHAEPELVEGIRRGRTEEFAGHGWASSTAEAGRARPAVAGHRRGEPAGLGRGAPRRPRPAARLVPDADRATQV